MTYEFEHVKDITKVILFVLFLCLLSCSSVCVMRFFNSSISCCQRLRAKIPLLTLNSYFQMMIDNFKKQLEYLTNNNSGSDEEINQINKTNTYISNFSLAQTTFNTRLPKDKFYIHEYFEAAAGNQQLSNGGINSQFTPIYDKNGDNVIVKYEGECYFLLFDLEKSELYRSAIPISSCTTWKSSISKENGNDKYKFTDFAQLCSC